MKKKIVACLLSLTVLFLGSLLFVRANPLQISPLVATGTATTTIAYMTAGTGTTTLQYDSYTTGQPRAADSAALEIQFTASSTSSVLITSFEYSNDGIDWYFDNLVPKASTPAALAIATPNSFTWTFASSTPGGVAGNLINRVGKIINVTIPTRYVRAVFTNTGTPAGVYAAFVPQKQISE